MPGSERPALVATDLDGTLLRDDKTVSDHTRHVLAAVQAAGIPVVPVTARQPYGLRPIAAHVGFRGPGVCANGAVVVDTATWAVLRAESIPGEVVGRVIRAVREACDEVVFAAVGPVGEWFRAEEGYAGRSRFSDHQRTREDMQIVTADELAADCSKLVLRRPGEDAAETLRLVQPLVAGCHATISGAPFVEVMAPGVTKSRGLAWLCERLGVERERVWAFGDAANDVDMLRWAGRAFAVADADPSVREVADVVIGTNAEDAVANALAHLATPTVQ